MSTLHAYPQGFPELAVLLDLSPNIMLMIAEVYLVCVYYIMSVCS